MWAAGLFLFLLGLIFIIVAPINKKKNARCSSETQGMLVDRKHRYNSEGSLPDMYYYSYSVDGVEYELKSTVRASDAYEPGDRCTIWYNPKKPKDAQPFHYDSAKTYKIIFIIGIVLVLAGIVLILAGIA